VPTATISSNCFERQNSLAEQRPLGGYFVAQLLSPKLGVNLLKFSMGKNIGKISDAIKISLCRPHTGPGPRWALYQISRRIPRESRAALSIRSLVEKIEHGSVN
jgi:hypothetical protein